MHHALSARPRPDVPHGFRPNRAAGLGRTPRYFEGFRLERGSRCRHADVQAAPSLGETGALSPRSTHRRGGLGRRARALVSFAFAATFVLLTYASYAQSTGGAPAPSPTAAPVHVQR